MSAKKVHFVIVIAIFFSTMSFGIENPIGSPTVPASIRGGGGRGYLTTPVSSIQDGQMSPARNPYGLEGNAIVTGNISGGRHFRGIVPYQSVSEVYGSSRTVFSTIESFSRYSSGDPYFDTTGGYQPFHLPGRTVTSLERDGQSGLTRPQLTFRGGTGQYALKGPDQPASKSSDYIVGRPFTRDTEGLEKFITIEIVRLKEELAEAEASGENDSTGSEFSYERLFEESLKAQDLDKPSEPVEPDKVLSLKEQLEEQLKRNQEKKSTDQLTEQLPLLEKSEEEAKQESQEKGSESGGGELKIPKLSHAEVKAILGEHENVKSFSVAKYEEYMRVAADFMKNNKYYRAADSYALAEVFKSNDPTAFIGRGHALFAAGEYMSSSYFIERAITISPEFASGKLDLATIFRDRDLYESRINKIAQWYKRTEAPELAFLLAYMFYQDGNLGMALQAIEEASEKMSDSPAFRTLKEIITKADEI